MKLVDGRLMRLAPWLIPFFTIGIFILDLVAPVGIAVSILYVIPLLLTLLSPRARDPLYFAAGATVLTWVDVLIKPAGVPLPYAMVNRALGSMVILGIAMGLRRYKQTQAELKSARVEQAHAEGLMMEAQEARYSADRDAIRAVVSRENAEEQLLISRLKLEGIIESAMDAIITVDEDQNVVLFNHAAEQMFGCSTQQAIGRPLDRFLPVRFREAHRHHIHAFGQVGVTARKMGRLGSVSGLRANGEEFPIEAAISYMQVERKKFSTVILRDITERHRVAEESRQQQEFIEAVLETAGALVVVLDHQGRILRFNRACEQATGYSSEEVMDKVVWDVLLPPEEVDRVKAVFDRLVGGESRNEQENVWVSKDGRRRRISWSYAVITNQHGSVEYVVGTGIDVTLLKQIQEQLRKTERIAELGTLASGMAHEIGTPMNVILGRAEYLMDRVTEEPIKKGLQTIITQVERITRVMNQLLSFARRKTPERHPLDLRKVIEDSVEIFHERLARNRIRVEMNLAASCPLVLADADHMNQVVINLIMNAVHAMPDGGTLHVGLAPAQQMMQLTIADTGHGMSKEVIKRIFEPFFTTKEFGQGTGLGLTVVKGIIEEHQGFIAVESEEGKGTTFSILLPLASTD